MRELNIKILQINQLRKFLSSIWEFGTFSLGNLAYFHLGTWHFSPTKKYFQKMKSDFKKSCIFARFFQNHKSNTMALEINSGNFEEVIKSDKLVIIDFWATWCGPCRALAPIMDELSNEYEGKVVIGKCDTDENNDIAMQFGVRNIPMLVFLKNGEVVETLVGLQRKNDLVKLIDSLI